MAWDIMRASMSTNYSRPPPFRNQPAIQSFRKQGNICFSFQRRRFCPFNQNCRYSYRCSVCGDSRHNSSNCRKQTNVTSSYGSTPPYTYKNNTHQPYTFGTAHNSTFSPTTKGNARQYYSTTTGGDLPTPIKVNRLAELLEGYDSIKPQY